MEAFTAWILNHASIAHWIIFGAILLAGCNIPVSVDALLIVSALLAAQVIPDKVIHLFCAVFFGCQLSAWIAFFLGKTVGKKWENRWLTKERMAKARDLYTRYGFFALLIGRFIPFGIRNCLFMSIGMSQASFKHFAIRDFFSCLIWSSLSFYLFYALSENYQSVWHQMKTFYLLFLSTLVMIGVASLWYKKRKKSTS